jgi:pimeloyl-ACP methyl ester carboxylesterase
MITSSAKRPAGPIEASILHDLAPVFAVRFEPAGGTIFRVLEGGSGPPLVLLHGRGHAATMWAPWLLALARHHRVIAPDLPGFGATPAGQMRPGGGEWGLEYFIEPVTALLEALSVRSPVLIGHSLGGLIALELALRGAVAPSALVLIGAMGLGPEMTYPARAYFLAGPERLARALGKDFFSRLSPLPDHPWGRRLAALEHELASVPGGRLIPSLAFNRLFPVVGDAFHRRARLSEIKAPVLLLHGEKDAAFPPSVARDAAPLFRHGRAQLLPLGHSPHLEDPERVLAEVESFLTSRS